MFVHEVAFGLNRHTKTLSAGSLNAWLILETECADMCDSEGGTEEDGNCT